MNMIEIGRRIKTRREALGISAAELGEIVGISKATIHRYEAAEFKSIKLPVIESIAIALNVNPAWLSCKTDDMTVEKPQTTINNPMDIRVILNVTRTLLSQGGITLDGEEMDHDSIQSVIDAMDNTLEKIKRSKKAQQNA